MVLSEIIHKEHSLFLPKKIRRKFREKVHEDRPLEVLMLLQKTTDHILQISNAVKYAANLFEAK